VSWIDEQIARWDEAEVRQRLKFYYEACVKEEHDIMNLVAEALGWPWDENYGYPTGDHTAYTLVQVLVNEHIELKGQLVNDEPPF
jgi:hypothetical protein